MNGLQILIVLAMVLALFLTLRSRRRRRNPATQVEQATPEKSVKVHFSFPPDPAKSAKKHFSLPPAFQIKRKKPFEVNANPLNHVTVRDPMTGMKASGNSRLGALAKLEGMTGRRIVNPQFRKK